MSEKQFMSAEDFISGCNQRGCTSARFVKTAEECNPAPPFTTQGLAHLASLLTDKNTASGGVQRATLTPDETKVWSMDFLSSFNPEGHLKVTDAARFVEQFARQIAEGMDLFHK